MVPTVALVEAETLPCAFSGSLQQIELLATQTRKVLGQMVEVSQTPVGEFLQACVTFLGGEIKVSRSAMGTDDPSGSLTVKPGGTFEIVLSPYTSPLRDTFTVAHELGHLFLHYLPFAMKNGLKDSVVFQRNGTGQLERQANRFAAAFLMPAEEFLSMVSTGADDYAVAASFGVSVSAVRIRRQALTR